MCRTGRGARGYRQPSLPAGAAASPRLPSAGQVFAACRHWNERPLSVTPHGGDSSYSR